MKAFDPDAETRKTRRNLPHWSQDGCLNYVTFRLADSLSREQLDAWKEERRAWFALHPQPWDEATWREYDRRFARRVDLWLDAGRGSCVLARPDAREVVTGALEHFDGVRYELDSFVAMPNHIHVLVTPFSGWELGRILHSWKSFSAKVINKLTGRTGTLWFDERFDHIVRSDAHRDYYRNYIAQNPVEAHLRDAQYTLGGSVL